MSNGDTALGVLREDLENAIEELGHLPAPVDCPNSGTPGVLRIGMRVLLRVELSRVERDIVTIEDRRDVLKAVVKSVLKWVVVAAVAAIVARLV